MLGVDLIRRQRTDCQKTEIEDASFTSQLLNCSCLVLFWMVLCEQMYICHPACRVSTRVMCKTMMLTAANPNCTGWKFCLCSETRSPVQISYSNWIPMCSTSCLWHLSSFASVEAPTSTKTLRYSCPSNCSTLLDYQAKFTLFIPYFATRVHKLREFEFQCKDERMIWRFRC